MRIIFLIVVWAVSAPSFAQAPSGRATYGSAAAAGIIANAQREELRKRESLTPAQREAEDKAAKEDQNQAELRAAMKSPYVPFGKWTILAIRDEKGVLQGGKPILARPVLISKRHVWLRAKDTKEYPEDVKVFRENLPKNEERMLSLIVQRMLHKAGFDKPKVIGQRR